MKKTHGQRSKLSKKWFQSDLIRRRWGLRRHFQVRRCRSPLAHTCGVFVHVVHKYVFVLKSDLAHSPESVGRKWLQNEILAEEKPQARWFPKLAGCIEILKLFHLQRHEPISLNRNDGLTVYHGLPVGRLLFTCTEKFLKKISCAHLPARDFWRMGLAVHI